MVDRTISFNEIEKTLLKNGSEFLSKIELLDEYRGDSIPETQTSLCIQLTFQSAQKTLVTKEIEKILKHLQTVLETEYNIDVRI